jgi:glycosyltransferase involved in cell wall biosynthesis
MDQMPGAGPRVLFVTCHLPFPPFSGGRRREYELITRLSNRFDVRVCAVTKTLRADRRHVPLAEEHCGEVRLFGAEGDGEVAHGVAPQVHRHASAAATRQIRMLTGLGGYDLVHVEGFYLMQHVPPDCPLPVLLTEQNIEYELWRQRMQHTADPGERALLERHREATYRAERDAWIRADMCSTVTAEDREAMLHAMPGLDVTVVPDGVDHCSILPAEPAADEALDELPADAPVVAMVGNFGYQPNVDSALQMCRHVFPRVQRAVPDARLLIVGTSPPAEVREAASALPNATVTGRVRAVEPYLDRADVVACPLRIGGGVKVKVLEALRRGRAIVTTSVGAQGLGEQARGALRIEDDPSSFADSVADLLLSPPRRERLEQAARRVAGSLPTWDEAADRLAGCYVAMADGAQSEQRAA